jgi:hypothetical protein
MFGNLLTVEIKQFGANFASTFQETQEILEFLT